MRPALTIAAAATALVSAALIQAAPISTLMQQRAIETYSGAGDIPETLAHLVSVNAGADSLGRLIKRQEDQLDARAPMMPTGGLAGKAMDEAAHASSSAEALAHDGDTASLQPSEKLAEIFRKGDDDRKRQLERAEETRSVIAHALDEYMKSLAAVEAHRLKEDPSWTFWQLGEYLKWQNELQKVDSLRAQDLEKFLLLHYPSLLEFRKLHKMEPKKFQPAPSIYVKLLERLRENNPHVDIPSHLYPF